MMKKWIAWLLVLLLAVSLLAGCGKKEPSLQDSLQQAADSQNEEMPEENKPGGELYDAGNVTVLVPEGWKAFPEADVFAEEEGAVNPNVLNVSKGGESEFDLFAKPYVRINYYGPDIKMGTPDASWYEDVTEIDPFTAGDHTWQGFSCTSMGTPLIIFWCIEGKIEYQASITVGSGKDALTATDADVLAILASVAPSNAADLTQDEPTGTDAPPVEEEPEMAESFWDGDWYGWWCIRDATGEYETFNSIAWDLYAEIQDYGDGSGYIIMWDTETSRNIPLVKGYLGFEEGMGEHTALTTEWCTFYEGGEWLPNVVSVNPMDFENWYVDPAVSTVSHFDNMIEIVGYYEDPDNSDNYFAYYMYLRPWGTLWDDVASGDTSGCLYSDMMPVIYGDWYAPLMKLGVEELPDCIEDGFALIEGGTSVEAEPFDGKPGIMELEALKEALEWVKDNQSYDNTYEQIVEGFGVPGLYVDEFESNGKIFCRYRWFADDDNRITITFEKQSDGTLTWNITAWDGLE